MNGILLAPIFLFTATIVSGCDNARYSGDANNENTSFPDGTVEHYEEYEPYEKSLDFEVLHEGFFYRGNTPKLYKVLSQQNHYDAELANYDISNPETIDFSNEKILLLDMGAMGGSIFNEVTAILESKYFTFVYITNHIPMQERGCLTETVLTNPFKFIKIPTRKPILIREWLSSYCL